MGALRYSDIQVGDAIASLTKPAIDRLQLALFAGASGDHNPIHVDEDAARSGGLPGVIAHGMLTMAFAGQLLSDLVSPKNIRSWSARFVSMAFPGDSVTCSATVAAKEVVNGENRVELNIAAENQKGEKLLLGKAVVVVP